MLCHVALVRTDVLEEHITSIIRVTRIGEVGTTLAVTSSVFRLLIATNFVLRSPTLVTPMMEAIYSSEESVLTRAIQRNIPDDSIPHGDKCSPIVYLSSILRIIIVVAFSRTIFLVQAPQSSVIYATRPDGEIKIQEGDPSAHRMAEVHQQQGT
jgi:hypothetical protein